MAPRGMCRRRQASGTEPPFRPPSSGDIPERWPEAGAALSVLPQQRSASATTDDPASRGDPTGAVTARSHQFRRMRCAAHLCPHRRRARSSVGRGAPRSVSRLEDDHAPTTASDRLADHVRVQRMQSRHCELQRSNRVPVPPSGARRARGGTSRDRLRRRRNRLRSSSSGRDHSGGCCGEKLHPTHVTPFTAQWESASAQGPFPNAGARERRFPAPPMISGLSASQTGCRGRDETRRQWREDCDLLDGRLARRLHRGT
jgi:hypothetical protein